MNKANFWSHCYHYNDYYTVSRVHIEDCVTAVTMDSWPCWWWLYCLLNYTCIISLYGQKKTNWLFIIVGGVRGYRSRGCYVLWRWYVLSFVDPSSPWLQIGRDSSTAWQTSEPPVPPLPGLRSLLFLPNCAVSTSLVRCSPSRTRWPGCQYHPCSRLWASIWRVLRWVTTVPLVDHCPKILYT